MYDADAIEAINFEQLATVTDRLLLRRGQVARRRPSIPSLIQPGRGTSPQLAARVYGSAPRLAVNVRGTQPLPTLAAPQASDEPTDVVRILRGARSQMFAVTVVIPALLGIAIGLAALL